ncbi:hypothetical protein GCM10023189_10240 [Nibrella saemangeumensis]|uniref:Uncharacterized protein n=1 Tax=Nibrella saemangeumensis TaxID=1084526 RepID=A0ABP8MHP9_9BACT
MLSHEKSTDLLDATMAALEGDPSSAAPQESRGLLDQWINALREGENTKEVADTLEQLKGQLTTDQPNPDELYQTLKNLVDKTKFLSTEVGPEGDLFTRLEGLVTALQQFSDKLANSDANQ